VLGVGHKGWCLHGNMSLIKGRVRFVALLVRGNGCIRRKGEE